MWVKNDVNDWLIHSKKPYNLIFYEAFKSKTDAVKDEIFFKTGYGKEVLKDKLRETGCLVAVK